MASAAERIGVEGESQNTVVDAKDVTVNENDETLADIESGTNDISAVDLDEGVVDEETEMELLAQQDITEEDDVENLDIDNGKKEDNTDEVVEDVAKVKPDTTEDEGVVAVGEETEMEVLPQQDIAEENDVENLDIDKGKKEENTDEVVEDVAKVKPDTTEEVILVDDSEGGDDGDQIMMDVDAMEVVDEVHEDEHDVVTGKMYHRNLIVYPFEPEDLLQESVLNFLLSTKSDVIKFVGKSHTAKQGIINAAFRTPGDLRKASEIISSVELPSKRKLIVKSGVHIDRRGIGIPRNMIKKLPKMTKVKAILRVAAKEVQEMTKVKDDDEPVTVFVNNIPRNTCENMLKFLFPSVKSIQLPTNSQGDTQGYGLLQFSCRGEARDIINKNRHYKAYIGANVLRLHIVGEEEEKEKRKVPETVTSDNKRKRVQDKADQNLDKTQSIQKKGVTHPGNSNQAKNMENISKRHQNAGEKSQPTNRKRKLQNPGSHNEPKRRLGKETENQHQIYAQLQKTLRMNAEREAQIRLNAQFEAQQMLSAQRDEYLSVLARKEKEHQLMLQREEQRRLQAQHEEQRRLKILQEERRRLQMLQEEQRRIQAQQEKQLQLQAQQEEQRRLQSQQGELHQLQSSQEEHLLQVQREKQWQLQAQGEGHRQIKTQQEEQRPLQAQQEEQFRFNRQSYIRTKSPGQMNFQPGNRDQRVAENNNRDVSTGKNKKKKNRGRRFKRLSSNASMITGSVQGQSQDGRTCSVNRMTTVPCPPGSASVGDVGFSGRSEVYGRTMISPGSFTTLANHDGSYGRPETSLNYSASSDSSRQTGTYYGNQSGRISLDQSNQNLMSYSPIQQTDVMSYAQQNMSVSGNNTSNMAVRKHHSGRNTYQRGNVRTGSSCEVFVGNVPICTSDEFQMFFYEIIHQQGLANNRKFDLKIKFRPNRHFQFLVFDDQSLAADVVNGLIGMKFKDKIVSLKLSSSKYNVKI